MKAVLGEEETSDMLTSAVKDLTLTEMATPADPSISARYTFPIYAATGAAGSAVVYFEVEPGKRLGRHTDSVEEIIYIVEGEGEAIIGEEQSRVSAGTLAVVPAQVPHDIRNTGMTPLKVVGFFAGASLVHVFMEPLLPGAEVAVITHDYAGENLIAGTPFNPAAQEAAA
jgi:quercetin dioxygenase-like cupin family protein